GHGDLFLDPVIDAVYGAVVVAGEVEHGLAHGLGRDGAGVDADAADDGARLDDYHTLVHLGCSHGCALTGGSGANDDQVILDTHAGVSPRLYEDLAKVGTTGMRRWSLRRGYHHGGEWTRGGRQGQRRERRCRRGDPAARGKTEWQAGAPARERGPSPGLLIWVSAWLDSCMSVELSQVSNARPGAP